MPIEYADSFGAYTAASNADLTASGWNVSGTSVNVNVSAGNGRRGGKCLRLSSTTGQITRPIPANATVGVAYAFKILPNVDASTRSMIAFLEGSTLHVTIATLPDGSIRAYRGNTSTGTVLGTSAPGVITAATYIHIEAEVVIHDSTGSVQVRLNGNTTPVLNLTNVDTRNAGTSGVVSLFQLDGLVGGGGSVDICDFITRTGAGFLGDKRVDYKPANANGTTNQFTPSAGSNYQNVDETTPSDADYNESSTVGHIDLYELENLSHVPTAIDAVIEKVRALKDDAGARSHRPKVRSGGVNYNGATDFALSTSAAYYHNVRLTDPNTAAAWTIAGVDALQVGGEVV